MAKAPTRAPRPPTRERILRAGVRLFQANGYHATGVVEILRRAEAPKGSFYHHFPGGKEALALAALTWLQGEVTQLLDGLAQEGKGSEDMVRGLARYVVSGLRDPERVRGFLFAILAQEAAHDSPMIQAGLTNYVDAIRDRLSAARTLEHPGADANLFATQALALLQGGAVVARVDGRPEIVEEVVNDWLGRSEPQSA